MTDKVIGYGVSWLGPDVQPDTIKRKRGDVPNPHAGRKVHHSERFKTLPPAKRYAKKLADMLDGREKIRLHQIELMDDIPGFPMAFWKEIHFPT
jgi:hypothetical protein